MMAAAALVMSLVAARPPVADAAGPFTMTRLLNQLTVRRENNRGYNRDRFTGWLDRDHDGCNTRAEVLMQESRRRVRRTASCIVTRGRWFSTYDGRMISRPRRIRVDHVVPLAEAWGSGARRWSAGTRHRYANDLRFAGSLRAVSQSSNRSKRDDDPAAWLPPRAAARCAYVRDWVAIKWRWGLSINVAERAAIRKVLRQCPTMRVWVSKAKVTVTPSPGADTTFSFAVVPDTQNETYAGEVRTQERVEWLLANRGSLDLRWVLHSGDVHNWDTPDHDQYVAMSSWLRPLDTAGMPWVFTPGNHDTAAVCPGGSACPGQDASVALRNTATWNAYYPPARFGLQGVFEAGKSDNGWRAFSAGGKQWLVLSLELWPRTAVINWAKTVVANHPHHNVIVVTHMFLDGTGQISGGNGGYGANSPATLWNALDDYPNVVMTFSGHVGRAANTSRTAPDGHRVAMYLRPSTTPRTTRRASSPSTPHGERSRRGSSPTGTGSSAGTSPTSTPPTGRPSPACASSTDPKLPSAWLTAPPVAIGGLCALRTNACTAHTDLLRFRVG